MANAVTALRDIQLSDQRTTDPNLAAILAYLEDTASQQPLPPLAPTRRLNSQQHLPPVRNLLHRPDNWQQQPTNGPPRSTGKVRWICKP
jgi:hypothetical protein